MNYTWKEAKKQKTKKREKQFFLLTKAERFKEKHRERKTLEKEEWGALIKKGKVNSEKRSKILKVTSEKKENLKIFF